MEEAICLKVVYQLYSCSLKNQHPQLPSPRSDESRSNAGITDESRILALEGALRAKFFAEKNLLEVAQRVQELVEPMSLYRYFPGFRFRIGFRILYRAIGENPGYVR